MAKTYAIRQALFDWQADPVTASFNVLITDDDGDTIQKMETISGAAVAAAADQLKTFALARAANRWPGKTITMVTPPPAA